MSHELLCSSLLPSRLTAHSDYLFHLRVHVAARAMTVQALHDVLQFYGLPTVGSKEVLMQRFFDFIGV